MKFLNKISDEEVKLLPKVNFEGDIVMIENFKEQNAAAEFLMFHRVIGFDTESRASFQKGVVNKIALLQLSAGGKVFLIRVNKVKLSAGIIKVLESESHIKVGVALRDDVKELRTVTDFEPRGFLDLQKIMGDFDIAELGLKKISAIVLGVQISKAQRLSNWEATVLTDNQQIYAATDAWICEEIFNRLNINESTIEKGLLVINCKNNEAKAQAKERRKRKYLLNKAKLEEEK